MRYDDLEDSIVTRLAPLLDDDIEVEHIPDNEEDYTRPFENPRVTVAYKASTFSDEVVRGVPRTLSINETVQMEFAEVHILVRSRRLRGDDGVYAVTEKVKQLLYGFRPDDWSRMHPKQYDLIENADGIFICDFSFVCSAMAVQDEPDDTTEYPALAELTFNTNIDAD